MTGYVLASVGWTVAFCAVVGLLATVLHRASRADETDRLPRLGAAITRAQLHVAHGAHVEGGEVER